MSVEWEADCSSGHGTAASFVTNVYVYVDGSLFATRDHQVVEGDTSAWTFTIPLDLNGTHTVRVTDQTPAGEQQYEISTTTMVCDVATTTTATATTVATTPAPAVTAASIPVAPTAAATTIATTVAAETTTAPAPPTTARVLAETVSAAPATLPATGSTTGPMVDVGLGFLLIGATALFAARRRIHQV